MSKRGPTLIASPRDFVPTPQEAFTPLLACLPPAMPFCEPCAGDGRLVRWMQAAGHPCVWQSDIQPEDPSIPCRDALAFRPPATVVTNPPFSWRMLNPLLCHWRDMRTPAILLLPSDMICNLRFASHATRISWMLPLGRVSWKQNGQGGFENYAWFRFSPVRQAFIRQRVKA